jgi:phage terminase small subunit
MPILQNPRHELFAQALAAGQNASQAYEHAGYKPNRGNATALKQNECISMRVSELLDEQQRVIMQSTAKAIEQAAITKTDVIRMLLDDRELARKANQASAAIRADELLGKQMGMFIDRRETGGPGEFDGWSEEELRAYIRSAEERFDGKRSTEQSSLPGSRNGPQTPY